MSHKQKSFPEIKEIALRKIPFLGSKLPLEIGVDKKIHEILKDELSKKEISFFAERFFNSAKYLKNCLSTDVRYSLDGKPVSTINHSQKMYMRIVANKVIARMNSMGGTDKPIYSELVNAVEPFNLLKQEKKKALNKKKKLKAKEKMTSQSEG